MSPGAQVKKKEKSVVKKYRMIRRIWLNWGEAKHDGSGKVLMRVYRLWNQTGPEAKAGSMGGGKGLSVYQTWKLEKQKSKVWYKNKAKQTRTLSTGCDRIASVFDRGFPTSPRRSDVLHDCSRIVRFDPIRRVLVMIWGELNILEEGRRRTKWSWSSERVETRRMMGWEFWRRRRWRYGTREGRKRGIWRHRSERADVDWITRDGDPKNWSIESRERVRALISDIDTRRYALVWRMNLLCTYSLEVSVRPELNGSLNARGRMERRIVPPVGYDV